MVAHRNCSSCCCNDLYILFMILDKDMYYILLDEVQFVNEFEDVLNSFLHIENEDTYVTGSNAKFLSKDIITEFRGRGDQIHLFPLSFSEFMPSIGVKSFAYLTLSSIACILASSGTK